MDQLAGEQVSREVNETIDLRQFEGTAGYALLDLAANRHSSRWELQLWLKRRGVERSDSWIARGVGCLRSPQRFMHPAQSPTWTDRRNVHSTSCGLTRDCLCAICPGYWPNMESSGGANGCGRTTAN